MSLLCLYLFVFVNLTVVDMYLVLVVVLVCVVVVVDTCVFLLFGRPHCCAGLLCMVPHHCR